MQHIYIFLLKLHPEFEATHSNLMNWDPSPSLDVCFGKLLHEEQRLLTHAVFQHDAHPNLVAYAAYGRGKGKDMSKVQCFDCREYGHIAANCANKVCNYCKKQGHFIKECPTRPPPRIFSTSSPTISVSVTPEMVQEIMSACPYLFQGNTSPKSWVIDSAASNHMTRSSDALCNIHPYHGASQI
jgi:hypothetical protein